MDQRLKLTSKYFSPTISKDILIIQIAKVDVITGRVHHLWLQMPAKFLIAFVMTSTCAMYQNLDILSDLSFLGSNKTGRYLKRTLCGHND